MSHPKSISAYPPELVRLLAEFAEVEEPIEHEFTFTTHGKAITFRTQCHALRKLLCEQAEQSGNYDLAHRLRTLRFSTGRCVSNNRNKPLSLILSNKGMGLDNETLKGVQDALESLPHPTSTPLEGEEEIPPVEQGTTPLNQYLDNEDDPQ